MTKRLQTDVEEASESALTPMNDTVIGGLVNNHGRFRSFLTKRVGNESDAEEILQRSLSKALEHSPLGTKEESILGWFFQVLRNALIDHYRSESVREKAVDALTHSAQIEADLHTLQDEVCECMKDLLPTLKHEYAEILRRVDLEERPAEQVAKSLDITRNSLDVRLHRARKALKTSLIKACGTCTEHGCLNCTCQ